MPIPGEEPRPCDHLPMGKIELFFLSDKPELVQSAIELNSKVWPSFVDATDASVRFWDEIYTVLPDYQVVMLVDDVMVACGHTVPVWWDKTKEGLPTGWDDLLTQGIQRTKANAPVNTLGALAVSILPTERGKGYAPIMIDKMKELMLIHDLGAFILPVRPTHKNQMPDMTMEDYIELTNELGFPRDPWLRTHHRMGGQIVKVAHRSMVVHADVEQWKAWTGLDFLAEQVVVPGALVPVKVLGDGMALYEEPNVWMAYPSPVPGLKGIRIF